MIAAKTAEPIVVPFGLRTQLGSRNHVLNGVQIPWEGASLKGEDLPNDTAVSCAKTAERKTPFGI